MATTPTPPPKPQKGLGFGFMVFFVLLLGFDTYFAFTYTDKPKVHQVTNTSHSQNQPTLGAYSNDDYTDYIEPAERYFHFEGVDYEYYTVLRLKPNNNNPIYRHGSRRTKIFLLRGNEYANDVARTVDSQGKSFALTSEATSAFNGTTHFTTSKEVLIGIAIINN